MYTSQKTIRSIAFMDHERQFVTSIVEELIKEGFELTSGFWKDGLVFAKSENRLNDAEEIELTKVGEIQSKFKSA